MGKKSRLARSRHRVQQQLLNPKPVTGLHRHNPDRPAQAPESMRRAYQQAQEWALQHPAEAAAIQQQSENSIYSLVQGIANAERLDFPQEECEKAARVIQLWCIFNGIVYLYDWPVEVASMSEQEIIDACRADLASGQLPPLTES